MEWIIHIKGGLNMAERCWKYVAALQDGIPRAESGYGNSAGAW